MEFPLHIRPNASRLEAFAVEIQAMRSQLWPYQRIADWLSQEKGHSVSVEGLRKFCNIRKIEKRKSRTYPNPQREIPAPPIPKSKVKKFHYDDSLPIEIHRHL